MRSKIAVLVPAAMLFLSWTAAADVCHYTDSTGAIHFVNDRSQVPEQYRSQVKEADSLPQVNRLGRPGPAAAETRLHGEPEPKKASAKAAVEIFMTSWCGYCRKHEAFLDAKGVTYTAYDIEKDRDSQQIYRQLGGRGVPLSRIGTTVVKGYNPEAVMRAVEAGR